MNKLFTVYIVGFLLMLCSCEQSKSGNTTRRDDFDSYVELKRVMRTHEDTLFLGRPMSITLLGGKLLIQDIYDDKTSTLVSTDFSESKRILSRGLGPNEIIGGYFLYPSSDGKTVTVYERGYNRVRTFEVDDFLEERLTNPISSSTINTGGLNLAPVGSNFIIGKPQKDLNLFSLIGDNGETIDRFGTFPSEMMEGFEADDTFLHMQIQLLVSSNKEKNVAVAAGYMSDLLCFYQIDDKGNAELLNQYRTYDTELDLSFSENGASAKYNDHTMDAYNSLYPTSAHLYALYRGCLMNSHKEHPYTYVQVFDWDGNFVKGYKLDAPVVDIAVDEDKGIIYGLYAGGDPHVRIYQMN
ncbi:MAG: hypothetical protein IKN48_03020 [Bacteroidaceae bacterium]|nr:hypothetical protein [Bacteroidaceae bacterium]